MAIASWTSGAFGTSNSYINYTITITLNSQDITSNNSNVTVSVRFYRTNSGYTTYGTGTVTCNINGTSYTASVDTNQKITESGIVLFSKTVNVGHNSDGTKTLAVSAGISHSRFTSGTNSYSHALNTIPRKSTMTVGNGTFGSPQQITVSRKSTSFTHTIELWCGKRIDTVCTKSTATTISYTPPLHLTTEDLYNVNLPVTFNIKTYSGNSQIGSASYVVMLAVPASIKPSCTLSVSDPTGYFSKYNGYVKSKSKLQVNVTGIPSYSCPVKSYSTAADGSTYSSASFTTGVLSSSGDITINSTVTDQRNRTGSASTTVNVLDYYNPKISKMNVHRCDETGHSNQEGSYVKIAFDASVTSLSDINSARYILKYKKSADSAYNNSIELSSYSNQYTVTDGSYIFYADTDSSYDIMLTVNDDFAEYSYSGSVSTAFTFMHFSSKGTGMGIGKIVEEENLLDIGLPVEFRKDITYDGALTKSSDIRVKKPIGDISIDEALAILLHSKLHKFTYKTDEKQIVNYGVYAQELRDLLIDSGIGHTALLRMKIENTDGEISTDLKIPEEKVEYSVDYTQYIPLLIAGWQYHEQKILELEKLLLELKGRDSDNNN